MSDGSSGPGERLVETIHPTSKRVRGSGWCIRTRPTWHVTIPALVAVGLFVLSSAAGGGMAPKSATASHLSTQVGRSITLYPQSNDTFEGLWVNLQGFPSEGQAVVNVYNASVPSFHIWSDPSFYFGESGAVNQTFTPPDFGSDGTYTFSANETGAANVTATFTDTPGNISLTATPSTVASGGTTDLFADGNGLPSGQEVNVYIGSTTIGYEDIDGGYTSADFDLTGVPIPPVPAGTYILFIQDDYGDYAATTITVTTPVPTLTLTPDQGNPGTPVTATGIGLTPSVGYGIYFNDGETLACSGTTNPDGSYSCSFDVPAVSNGYNMVEAIDADEVTAGANFDVQAIQVHELTESQTAGWFLSFSPLDPSVTKYDYTVNDQKYFELSYWRLDTMKAPDLALGTETKSVYDQGGSYVFLQLPLTKNLQSLITDYFQGTHITSLFITGYTNLDGEVGQFLKLELSSDLITYESISAVNGSAPLLSLNISFYQLNIEEQKSQVGLGSSWNEPGDDEWILGTVTTSVSMPETETAQGSLSDPDYIMTSSKDGGTVTDAKRTGTEIWTWDEASPHYLNMTTKFSGGGMLWALTTDHFTWMDMIAYTVAGNGNEHQEFAFDFTNLATQRVVLVGHDGFVPTMYLYFTWENLDIKYLGQ